MTTASAETRGWIGRWNTLQRLKISRAAIVALDGLLLVAIVLGARMHQGGMKTLGKDSAPSIIAAQHIKTALADMDAAAANELLAPPGLVSTGGKAFEAHRVEASKALIAAAENITYGDAERAPIQTLQVEMGSYERDIQRALDLHLQGDAGWVLVYRVAEGVMDQLLLPAADALDQANNAELERAYEGEELRSTGTRAFVLGAGILAALTLGALQVFLSQRMRRTLNPLLLVATLLTLGWTIHALAAMDSEQRQLKLAKEDAFASIHALWRARAIAYEASSDESRYLLDPARASENQRGFIAKTDALAKVPGSMNGEQVVAKARAGEHVDGFSGYLADELNNITFPGEREAATRTLAAWERYIAIDAQMRTLEREGHHAAALALCLGTQEGQSDWAFAQFDDALTATLAINRRAFDDAVAKGFAALSGLEFETFGVTFGIALLVFFGLAPRIREYE